MATEAEIMRRIRVLEIELSHLRKQLGNIPVRWAASGAPGATGGGDALPPGGLQYQVLQRNAALNAAWDWVRAHD